MLCNPQFSHCFVSKCPIFGPQKSSLYLLRSHPPCNTPILFPMCALGYSVLYSCSVIFMLTLCIARVYRYRVEVENNVGTTVGSALCHFAAQQHDIGKVKQRGWTRKIINLRQFSIRHFLYMQKANTQ